MDELHWHDLFNDESMRRKFDLPELVTLAKSMVLLLEECQTFVFMRSADDDTFTDVDETVEWWRDVTGLRTGNRRDDVRLYTVLRDVWSFVFGNSFNPGDEVLAAIDQRSGSGR